MTEYSEQIMVLNPLNGDMFLRPFRVDTRLPVASYSIVTVTKAMRDEDTNSYSVPSTFFMAGRGTVNVCLSPDRRSQRLRSRHEHIHRNGPVIGSVAA